MWSPAPRSSGLRSALSGRALAQVFRLLDRLLLAPRKHPAGPHEMARVAVGVLLQVVLVLILGLPERAGRGHLGDDLAGPQARRVDVRDRVQSDGLLLVAGVEDGRAVAAAHVVALAVRRRGVV